MNHSSDYLSAMGIMQWRLRGAVKSPAFCRYEFYNDSSAQPVALLLAEMSLENETEEQLVAAIAKAIKKNFSSEKISKFDLQNFTSTRVVILLGKQVATLAVPLLGAHPHIISYSPAELLTNPQLKAKTWEEIKKAIQMMI